MQSAINNQFWIVKLEVIGKYYRIRLKFQMENTKPMTSLEQKLELLRKLREGKLDESQKLLLNLSKTTRTNPELYRKFYSFVNEHKSEIKRMEEDQKEIEPIIINEDDGDQDWETDQDVSFGSESEEENEPKTKGLLKNVTNCKSSVLIRGIKEQKRQFLVQTKGLTKQTFSSTTNLKDLENNNFKTIDCKKTGVPLSKSSFLPKIQSKGSSKPYFCGMAGTKTTLKLVKK